MGPLVAGTIPIELQPVLIRIAKIERFTHAMVRRPVERDSGADQPSQRVGKRRARRIADRDVVKTGSARRWWRPAEAFPGVQSNMVVIAAGRDERRRGTVAQRDLK